MIEFNRYMRYRELCMMFNEEPKRGGTNVKSHINKFKQNYEIDKKDGKYCVIRELTIIEKIESQMYHKNREYIEPMLYTILSNEPTNILRFGMRELMVATKLVNEDYHYAKYNSSEVDVFLTGQDSNGVKTFTSETEPMYRRILKDVLYDMEDKKLIEIYPITVFAKTYVSENGKRYTKTYDAKKEDLPKLLECQREAIKQLKVNKWSELNYFQQIEAKRIVADLMNIDYYYHNYNIVLNKNGIKEEMVLNNYEDVGKSFNKYIQDKTFTSKRKGLKLLTDEEKRLYIDALVNIDKDLNLRNKKL